MSLISGRIPTAPGGILVELGGSRDVDLPLAAYDVDASRAHVAELARLGLIDDAGAKRLDEALEAIADELARGTFAWRSEAEDIHMNVEAAVRDAVGPELAGQLQAGRSRNDEVVTDERRWLRDAVTRLDLLIVAFERTLSACAADEIKTILPAHTHTQPAQPVLLAHHLLAYVEMLERDRGRLADVAKRANRSPAGSAAVAGSGLALDREATAQRHGFDGPTANSLDAIADRDYAIEMVSACAIAANHLSRIAAELVLWSTPYLGFVRLADGLVSGSSMLPQKRNPDAAELVRARAARLNGTLTQLLQLTAGLPLAYHRDFQETRGPMFAAVETLEISLRAADAMIATATFDREAMRRAAARGHGTATALAEKLVRAGVPFRDAHHRVGALVAQADAANLDLSELPQPDLAAALPELKDHDPIMPTLEEAVAAADVIGGTAPRRVEAALAATLARLEASE
ncbi:MAG: argininosuccinate lyase [Chloroflexota bacterium]